MECADIQKKLSSYIDNALSPEEKMLIDEHLTSCQKCSASLADMRKTLEYIQKLEDIEPPLWLTQKVMEKVKSEAKPKMGILQKLFYPLHIKLPIEAAAVFLIAVAAIYIFKTIQPEIKLAQIPSEEIKTQAPFQEKDKLPAIVEIKPVPSKPAEKQLFAKKPEVTGKVIETHRAPSPVLKEAEAPLEARPSAGAVAKDEQKTEVLSRAPRAKTLAEKKEEIFSLIIKVKDIKTASKEIERVLIQFKGQIIRTESFENREVITAKLDSKKLKELIYKLKLIGEIKEVALDGLEGNIEIKIEIVQ
jgi:hypothetical protein